MSEQGRIQRRLVNSVHQALFDELKDMRLSRQDAKTAIAGITEGSLSANFRSSAYQALYEYMSYCDAVEIV